MGKPHSCRPSASYSTDHVESSFQAGESLSQEGSPYSSPVILASWSVAGSYAASGFFLGPCVPARPGPLKGQVCFPPEPHTGLAQVCPREVFPAQWPGIWTQESQGEWAFGIFRAWSLAECSRTEVTS